MIPVPNVVRCALEYRANGLPAFNIINVLCPAPATSGDLTAIAALLQTWWNGTLRPISSAQVIWIGATLTALDSSGAPFLVYANTGTPNGPGGGGLWPPQVTLAISFGTGLAGRSFRGRLYFIQLQLGTNIIAGIVDAGAVATIQGVYNTLRTQLAAGGYPLVIASLYSGVTAGGVKIPRTTGISTLVTSVTVKPRADTQRRRLPSE